MKLVGLIVGVVVFSLGLIAYSADASSERFKSRDCEPVKGMYYRTRAGHLRNVLICDEDNKEVN